MSRTETYEKMGFTLTYPEEFENTRGLFMPLPVGGRGNGLYFMLFNYLAMTGEEAEAMNKNGESKEVSKEDQMEIMKKMGILLTIAGIDGGRGPKEIMESMQTDKLQEDMFAEVGRCGDIVYYALSDPKSEKTFLDRQDPAFAEEFRRLQASLIETMKNAEYFTPRIPGEELIGKTIRFETADIDGRPVKGEELFAGHAVTMINCWATWCGPCKSELKDLGEIHRRITEKDAAIVGICTDADQKPDECRALIAENNITYLNILPYASMNDELNIRGIPTSFFIDRKGTILTHPVIGVPADITEYEKIFERLLSQDQAEYAPLSAESSQEKKHICRVIVTGSDDLPAEGVTVQFCSDTACMTGKTDADGIACFRASEGHYTVHIMNVPEGYTGSEETFDVPDSFGDVRIMLEKA